MTIGMSADGKQFRPRMDPEPNRPRQRVVVLDSDDAERARLGSVLGSVGFDVDLARSRSEAESLLKSGSDNFLVVRLEGLGPGDLGFLVERRELDPWLPIVALGSPELCDELGLAQTVTSALPCSVSDTVLEERIIADAACARARRHNVRLMRSVAESNDDGVVMLGHSPAFRAHVERLHEAVEEPLLLVCGEEGSGRATSARYLHAQSTRADRPFLELSARTNPDVLMASIASVEPGTLFLTELEELDAESELRLCALRREPQAPSLVFSTQSDLEALEQGPHAAFIAELRPVVLEVPPLRARREDIAVMATFLLDRQLDVAHEGFTLDALLVLQSYRWPGNISELDRVVRAALQLADGEAIGRRQLLGPKGPLSVATQRLADAEADEWGGPDERDVLPFEQEERHILARALQATDGNVTKAAQLLQIGRATLYRKIHQYDLQRARRARHANRS